MTGDDAKRPAVLLVEDDASVTEVMSRYLDASGYETRGAQSVAAALRLVQSDVPDVIVTDIFLSDGDAFGLIQAVRSIDANVPIIAISGGRAGFDVLAQAAKLGASATIEKPFSGAYLVDTIDRCLEERRVSPEA